jgi:hypothetical protein
MCLLNVAGSIDVSFLVKSVSHATELGRPGED